MSRRTSTTRAYKSGGAGRAAGGKPALVRRGPTVEVSLPKVARKWVVLR
ncbi:mCG66845 [Mus musculus]|nr:mCG66845 [Mus musculus]